MAIASLWDDGNHNNRGNGRYIGSKRTMYQAPTREVSEWLYNVERLANQEVAFALEAMTEDAMDSLR